MLNCDPVTTNMADEIRRIGLNFEDAEKGVHGVEAMVESHTASISQLINAVHNSEHSAVSSTSTGEAREAKVPATEVRRTAANLEITSAQVATLTGQMHHWETMPEPELAKVEALELQVRLLMTRLEQSEHEVHALREEIRSRHHGAPPERDAARFSCHWRIGKKTGLLGEQISIIEACGYASGECNWDPDNEA